MYKSPNTFADFKVVDPMNPEDYGRRCRILTLAEGRFELRVKYGKQFLSVGQAAFRSLSEARAWALVQHCAGQLEAA